MNLCEILERISGEVHGFQGKFLKTFQKKNKEILANFFVKGGGGDLRVISWKISRRNSRGNFWKNSWIISWRSSWGNLCRQSLEIFQLVILGAIPGENNGTIFVEIHCPIAGKISERISSEIPNGISSEIPNWNPVEVYEEVSEKNPGGILG